MIGIYQIKNLINGKIYLGSSVNVFRRWWDHKGMLKRNTHTNIHLQRAWNKHGEENFEFKMIEVCTSDKLLSREQFWIEWLDCCNDKIGYNLSKCTEAPARGAKRTLEQRKKLSDAHKGIKPSPEAIENMRQSRIGFKYSLEARQNMSIAQKNNKHLFKPDKWPHGSRCRCDDCKIIYNKDQRSYPKYEKKKKIVIMKGWIEETQSC
jgi:group I intron endonuclease